MKGSDADPGHDVSQVVKFGSVDESVGEGVGTEGRAHDLEMKMTPSRPSTTVDVDAQGLEEIRGPGKPAPL